MHTSVYHTLPDPQSIALQYRRLQRAACITDQIRPNITKWKPTATLRVSQNGLSNEAILSTSHDLPCPSLFCVCFQAYTKEHLAFLYLWWGLNSGEMVFPVTWFNIIMDSSRLRVSRGWCLQSILDFVSQNGSKQGTVISSVRPDGKPGDGTPQYLHIITLLVYPDEIWHWHMLYTWLSCYWSFAVLIVTVSIYATKMLQEFYELVRSQASDWRITSEVIFDTCVILVILNRLYVTASIYRNRPVSLPLHDI